MDLDRGPRYTFNRLQLRLAALNHESWHFYKLRAQACIDYVVGWLVGLDELETFWVLMTL